MAATVPLDHAHADDLAHRKSMMQLAMITAENNNAIEFPFLSTGELMRETTSFSRSSGSLLTTVAPLATSAYDSSVVYDVASFYKSQNMRLRFIINYAEPVSKVFFSFGYDSGMVAEKLEITKSFFLGLTKGLKIKKNNFLLASAGQWFGGRVSESPCLDSYDREYWCPNLTAWIDRPAVIQRQEKYAEIRYIFLF